MCVFIYVHVSLCVQCVCWYPRRLEECTPSPGAGFTNSCELQVQTNHKLVSPLLRLTKMRW